MRVQQRRGRRVVSSLAESTDATSVDSFPVSIESGDEEDEQESSLAVYGGRGGSSRRLSESLSLNLTCGDFSVNMFKSPTKLLSTAPDGQADGTSHIVKELQRLLQTECRHVMNDLARTGEVVDDSLLERWVHAQKLGQPSATSVLARLRDHATWRLDFVGSKGISEESIRGILDANVMFLQGNDSYGYPVLLFLAKNYNAERFSRDELSRCMIYAIDGAMMCADTSKNPKKQIKWVFDLEAVNRRNVNIEFLEAVFSLFQAHYPECLHRLYFVNAPFIFWAIWGCVSSFLSPETREKIEFISARGSDLLSRLGPSVLPEAYGGCAFWKPLEDSVGHIKNGGIVDASMQDPGDMYTYSSNTVPVPSFSSASVVFWSSFLFGFLLWVLLKVIL
jgi:hypothetical protein